MEKQKTLTVTLETVTPLFLGGAEPRDRPELRPPAFRGALRYWLRAALGGMVGDDAETVRQLEMAVFGSADENKGGASAVTVRMAGHSSLSPRPYSQIAEWDHRSRSFKKPGIAYLLFAARGTNQEQERSGLLGNCTLHLSARPGVTDSAKAFERTYCALWLLVHFGGIGSRSRRGAGGLQVTGVQGNFGFPQNLLPLNIQASTAEGLATELKQGLEAIHRLLRTQEFRPAVHRPSAFDIVHPQACRIWVLEKTFSGWNHALDNLGRAYQGFRSKRSPDYQTVKESLAKGVPLREAVKRAAFGLPIPFYYRSLQGSRATLEPEKQDRRASPLWMRIVKLTSGAYAIVLLWFQSEFLPAGERIQLRQGRKVALGDLPEDKFLETFILGPDPVKQSSLKEKGLRAIEVRYA